MYSVYPAANANQVGEYRVQMDNISNIYFCSEFEPGSQNIEVKIYNGLRLVNINKCYYGSRLESS